MTRDSRKTLRRICARGLVLAGVLATTSGLFVQSASTDEGRKILSVRISHDPVRRTEDLRDLSQFDILGVSLADGLAEVSVTNRELESLKALGFQIEFSPLNAQLNRESLEPYMTPTEVNQGLEQLAEQHPALTQIRTIGSTRRKRPIQALIISANPSNADQPTLLFNAMHHAREVMTTEVVMHMAELLLEQYGKDSEITSWLNSARIIVVPQVNPDGNQFVHDGQNMWRKNAWESDGRTFGVDINRNYPTLWGACNGSSTSKMSDSYRGPAAASEPETSAMMNLVLSERPVANISYHSFSEMILYPYGCRAEKNPALELFKSIGAEMKAEVIDDRGNKNTYELGTPPELLYEADGTDADWQFREGGVLAFAMEVNSRMQGFQPAHKKWRDLTVTRQEGAWKALIRRTLAHGVKGVIRSVSSENVRYRIYRKTNSVREEFAGSDATVKPFQPRSTNGFIYNVLLPGDYAMELSVDGKVVRSVNFTVQDKRVTDLGEINL